MFVLQHTMTWLINTQKNNKRYLPLQTTAADYQNCQNHKLISVCFAVKRAKMKPTLVALICRIAQNC